MLPSCSIRVKLFAAIGLIVLLVAILAATTLYTTYSFGGFVDSFAGRSSEMPVAAELGLRVNALHMTVKQVRAMPRSTYAGFDHQWSAGWLHFDLTQQLSAVDHVVFEYQLLLNEGQDDSTEWREHQLERLGHMETQIDRIRERIRDENWTDDDVKIDEVDAMLAELRTMAERMSTELRGELSGLSLGVQSQHGAVVTLTWIAGLTTAVLFVVFLRLFYQWIFQPLQVLIDGSRHVASGRFNYRIHLETHDEMAELAEAMNQMTERFETIRDDLDRQVRERTNQVVRSEQLASVGFLAAGVAHEINNPLASIAMCAESLEGRIARIASSLPTDSVEEADEEVVNKYLRMIQDEAFRCREITERLLDFSRMGRSQRERADLVEIVQGVVDMVRHLGKYQQHEIAFEPRLPIHAEVNAQEMKQIVLNLLTNALDSLDESGGRVAIEAKSDGEEAELTFRDNGCGMNESVRKHLFEPFFTQRRRGQGTGLGLSITHRIVTDHGGEIDARSDGPERGSTFHVRLPLTAEAVENEKEDWGEHSSGVITIDAPSTEQEKEGEDRHAA